jgi:signal transduction histidine kinase|tara:strand:- start:2287 stop:3111 length:825 start_codon:yes stop_codon:yes gene_type:complete
VVLNRFGNVENLNQVAKNLLGCSLDDAREKSISDIFHAFDPDTDQPIDLASKQFRKAAERATDLTQQLLSFSRRNKNLKPEVLDAIKVTRDMQKILRRLIPENIRFDLQFAEHPVYVNLNRTSLEQILINFTTNARDAMPDGGEVALSMLYYDAEEAAKYLPEHIEARHYMILSFQDNGMGIGANTQKHIFEPFFTTKDQGKGTGLGLVVKVGADRFILPTTSVKVALRPDAEMMTTIQGNQEVLNLRGKIIPLFRLHDHFQIENAVTDPKKLP